MVSLVRLQGQCHVGRTREHVVPAGQAPLLHDHLAQPVAGVRHQHPAALDVTGQQRRHPVGHPRRDPLHHGHLVAELRRVRLEPHRPLRGRHPERRRPRPHVRLLRLAGPLPAEPGQPLVDPGHRRGQPVGVLPGSDHGRRVSSTRNPLALASRVGRVALLAEPALQRVGAEVLADHHHRAAAGRQPGQPGEQQLVQRRPCRSGSAGSTRSRRTSRPPARASGRASRRTGRPRRARRRSRWPAAPPAR